MESINYNTICKRQISGRGNPCGCPFIAIDNFIWGRRKTCPYIEFLVNATLAVALFYGRRETCPYNYATESNLLVDFDAEFLFYRTNAFILLFDLAF
jgi:hypothetical protein